MTFVSAPIPTQEELEEMLREYIIKWMIVKAYHVDLCERAATCNDPVMKERAQKLQDVWKRRHFEEIGQHFAKAYIAVKQWYEVLGEGHILDMCLDIEFADALLDEFDKLWRKAADACGFRMSCEVSFREAREKFGRKN